MKLMESVDKKSLREAFLKSWSRETSYPKTKDQWSPKNPSFGQCAVTSLIVNDLYGGKIVYNNDYHHFWNILQNGRVIDLTRSQFEGSFMITDYVESTRESMLNTKEALSARTQQRYKLLKKRIEKILHAKKQIESYVSQSESNSLASSC